MVYWNKNNLNIQIKINSNSVEGYSRSPFMIFNPRRELTDSCTGNIAGFSSFILRFGLEEKSNTSSWTSQAVPGCTWVGLDWGRDYGLVFLDPWDHKLHPTRVPLCLAPHWWFHSKIACRLGKAAVKQFSSEIIGPKLQLSALLCTPRLPPHLPWWRCWGVSRLP